MNGVIILCLKKPAYALGAFNLALSIKHFNPSIDITLVSDGEHKKHYRPEHYSVFNKIKDITLCDYIDKDGRFQPAIAKINIHKYSDYKRTLFIDADSLVLKDIGPLFDLLKGSKFKSNFLPSYTQWTDEASYKSFFGMDFGMTVNSSWYYFEDKKVLEQANKFYLNGFDIDKIAPKWGGTFPDELFINAAINKLAIDPKPGTEVMFFGNQIDSRTYEELINDFYAFTLYGGSRTVRDTYVTWYDRLCFNMCTKLGIEHRFKAYEILTGKHVNR